MNALHQRIDQMAEQAKIEIHKDGLRARCQIEGLVSWHIRSIAQRRRFRNKAMIDNKGESK